MPFHARAAGHHYCGHVPNKPNDRRFQPNDHFYRFIVRSGLFVRWLFRIDVQITGLENLPDERVRRGYRVPAPGRGAVVAMNHFGLVDFVFAELAVFKGNRSHIRFMITRKRAGNAFMQAVVQLCDHIVVDRAHGEAALTRGIELAKRGEYVGIFAEGSTNLSYQVRPLKTGAVRIAAETGVPIIPVSVFGAHRIITRGRKFSLRDAWRAKVRVHIGEPLRVGSTADIESANEELRARLQGGVDVAIRDYPAPLTPGAWWLPTSLGGSAMTPEQDAERYAEERSRYGETG